MTLKEIAKELGVAPSTVSKAINNRPDISEGLKKKILDYIDEVNYTPNQTARNLSLKIRDTIAVMMFGDFSSMGMTFLNGIVKQSKDLGLDIQIFSFDEKDTEGYLSHCYRKQVAGGIIYGLSGHDPNLKALSESKIPLVIVDQYVEGENVKRLTLDSEHAEKLVVDYLKRLDKKRGVYLAACSTSDVAVARRDAFVKFTNVCEIGVDVYTGDFSYDYGFSIDQLCDLKDVDFIHTSSDLVALGVKDKLERLNLDILVVGYDDIPEAKYRKLTTISQHPEVLGRKAVDLLLSEKTEMVLEPELIIRD